MVFATTSAGYGGAPNLLATTSSDSNGNWSINTAYTCPAGQQAYIVATGGNPGLGGAVDNTAIFLVAALGPCSGIGASTHININEVMPLTAYTKFLAAGTYRRGYIESANATIERSLPAGFDLTASYVLTQSIRQNTYLEANAGQTPGLGAAGQPLFTAFGRNAQTQEVLPFSTANYNGLQFNLQHPFSHGVLLTASYTYSKSLDSATDDDTVPLFNAIPYLNRNHAVSDFNRTHVFDAGSTAELPFGKDHAFLKSRGVVSAVVGGWKVNGVLSKFPGLPFTPIASATSLNAPFNTQIANKVKSNAATLHGIGRFATWLDTTAFAPVTTANSAQPVGTRL